MLGLTDDGVIWLARLGRQHEVRRLSPDLGDAYFGGYRWESVAFSATGQQVIAIGGRDSSGARLPYVMRPRLVARSRARKRR